MNDDLENVLKKMETMNFDDTHDKNKKEWKSGGEIVGTIEYKENEIHISYKNENIFILETNRFDVESELEQKVKFILACYDEDIIDRMNEILDYLEKTKLILTCGACPEQYDLFIGDEEYASGYLRTRHGFFSASYKDERVFSSNTEGDGIFEDSERGKFLFLAKISILNAHLNKENEFKYTI